MHTTVKLFACALMALMLRAVASEPMAAIPAGVYRPFFRGENDAKEIAVAAFQLDAHPVTNAEFLDFVRANPQWQRSRVKRLFADDGYLRHWAGDLDFGGAEAARRPVVFVSWFAAKAYAAWKGKRLPTTAEWEFAAGAGYESADGAKEPEFLRAVQKWYSTPTADALPTVGARRANFFGVHDLHGLVWEWTSDFNSALVTGDARGDRSLDRQLFCGAGSLGAKDPANFAAFMRFGFRSSLKAGYTVHNLGLRCARDAQPPCCRESLPPGDYTDRSLYQLDTTWTSDTGREFQLGSLRDRPQVVAMFFAQCEYACPLLVHEMQRIEQSLPAAIRDRVGFLLVSFDTERDSPDALRAYREKMRLAPERWTLLRGAADDVRELAALLGVNFQKDAGGQFAHSNVITVLNSQGEIVHQQTGLSTDQSATLHTIESAAIVK